jgi:chromosome segregation ATPase
MDKHSTNPLRATLADALQKSDEAKLCVNRQHKAVEKTRFSIHAAQRAVEGAEKNLNKAQHEYAAALADAAADDEDAPAPKSAVPAARQAIADAQDEVESRKNALAQLKADLPAWEAAARDAEIAVETAISAVLAEEAQKLLDKARVIDEQLMPFRKALAPLGLHQSSGMTDILAFERGQKPLEQIRSEVTAFLYGTQIADQEAADAWRSARELLRADPYAQLDFTAIVTAKESSAA